MTNIPIIVGNIAASLDGKIAPFDRSRLNISCKEDFDLRDEIRTAVDGVLVGGVTLINDGPLLTLKNNELIERRIKAGRSSQPAGIALCGKRMPDVGNPFFSARDSRRIIICGREAVADYTGHEIIRCGNERPDICEAMEMLYQRGIRSLMVEGGGTVMFEFLKLGLMQEFYLSIHPIIIGGATAPTIFDGKGFAANEIGRVSIEDCWPLSDGGCTYHCTINGYQCRTNYLNKKFILKEN